MGLSRLDIGASEDVVGDLSCCGFVHAFDDVAVGLEGEGDGGVAEPFADDLGVDSGLEGGCGIGVPDVV